MDIIKSFLENSDSTSLMKYRNEIRQHEPIMDLSNKIYVDLTGLKPPPGKRKLDKMKFEEIVFSAFTKIDGQIEHIADAFEQSRISNITADLLFETFELIHFRFIDNGIKIKRLIDAIITKYCNYSKKKKNSPIALLQEKMASIGPKPIIMETTNIKKCVNRWEFTGGKDAKIEWANQLKKHGVIVNDKVFLSIFNEHSKKLKIMVPGDMLTVLVITIMILYESKLITVVGTLGKWGTIELHLYNSSGVKSTKSLSKIYTEISRNPIAHIEHFEIAFEIIDAVIKKLPILTMQNALMALIKSRFDY